MATISWPDDLPAEFLASSYSEALSDNVIRNKYDFGPDSLRRRSSATIKPAKGTMRLDEDQWTELKAFYADVLLQGSLAFGVSASGDCDSPFDEWLVRFTEPPTRQRMDGEGWQVTIAYEVLPQ